jgi:hypothetical protein
MPLDSPSLDSGFRRSDDQRTYFIVIPAEAGIQNMSDVQTIMALLISEPPICVILFRNPCLPAGRCVIRDF